MTRKYNQQDRGVKSGHKYYSEEESNYKDAIMAENINFGNTELTATQNYQNKENSKSYGKSKSKGGDLHRNQRNNDDNNIKMEDINNNGAHIAGKKYKYKIKNLSNNDDCKKKNHSEKNPLGSRKQQ
eukprot:2227695-Ditylum_brightwellii.AAC.1